MKAIIANEFLICLIEVVSKRYGWSSDEYRLIYRLWGKYLASF